MRSFYVSFKADVFRIEPAEVQSHFSDNHQAGTGPSSIIKHNLITAGKRLAAEKRIVLSPFSIN